MKWNHVDEFSEWFQSLDFCNPKFHLELWGRFPTKRAIGFFNRGGKQPPPRFWHVLMILPKLKTAVGFFLTLQSLQTNMWLKTIKLWSLRTNVKHHFPDRKLLNDIRALKVSDASLRWMPILCSRLRKHCKGLRWRVVWIFGRSWLGVRKKSKATCKLVKFKGITKTDFSKVSISELASNRQLWIIDNGFDQGFRGFVGTSNWPIIVPDAPESRFSIGQDRWWFQQFFLFSLGLCNKNPSWPSAMWWIFDVMACSPPK